MNEHLYDMSGVVISGANGETIGELPEGVEMFCPDASPAPSLTPEPIQVEAELTPDAGKRLRAMADAIHIKTINEFAQACLNVKLSASVMRRVAEALGVEVAGDVNALGKT